MGKLAHYFKSLLLWELFQGMGLTLKYLFKPKYTCLLYTSPSPRD